MCIRDSYMRAQAGLNEKLFLEFDLVQSLRYGENPHQSAKFYREQKVPYSLAFARQLNGKELSYNNIQDANAALCIVSLLYTSWRTAILLPVRTWARRLPNASRRTCATTMSSRSAA